MPQWQFKLFEYDIREELETDKNEYVPGKDTQRFIVQMYGIDEFGKTACIFVKGYNPFFYVKVDDDWNNQKLLEFVAQIKKDLGSYYEDSLVKYKLLKRHKLYGFDNKREYNFVQLKFTSVRAFNKCKNLWYVNTVYGSGDDRKLKPDGYEFSDCKTELYEAQIPPLLRLFHIRKIKS